MTFTQKYAIISPLEAISESVTFLSSNWPLHVTIADTFAIDKIDEGLISRLALIVKDLDLYITGKIASQFGKDKNIEVMLLQSSDELYQLHLAVIDELLHNGAIFNDPQYIKSGFVGHVTQQASKRIGVNQRADLYSIALIDMFPDNDPYKRRVLKIINFNKE